MAVISEIWGHKFAHFDTINTTLVTLIPKREGAEEVKDFRPISLVHSMAKLRFLLIDWPKKCRR